MLDSIAQFLDWFGICVFALSGALVASRKKMDIVGFALLGSVTGIGGGSVRDVLLGTLPVFWVKQPAYLITCILLSCGAFFFVHLVRSRLRFLIWCDAVGLALFSVSGASISIAAGTAPTIAIAMGVVTATFGGHYPRHSRRGSSHHSQKGDLCYCSSPRSGSSGRMSAIGTIDECLHDIWLCRRFGASSRSDHL